MALLRLLFLLACCFASPLLAQCPLKCACYLDNKGRRTVACKEGGIVGPLDVFNITGETEVLTISAPENNLNELTMSPVLHSYKNLYEIHITRSNIPQLGKHFFWGLKKLDILELSQNNITQPLDHNFIGLSHLKELYLDDNRINSLPSGTFRYLRELKVLSIQRNRIEELTPRIFLEIGRLKVLKLSGNRLRELNPLVFEDVKELRTLECRSCGLSRIDKAVFELLPDLTHLDLGDNELTYLTQDEFLPLANLRHLLLDGNRISLIPAGLFVHQQELKRLNLGRNRALKIPPDALFHLHNLTELDLSHNKLENPERGLFEPVASTLEVLSLNGNHLRMDVVKELLKKLSVKELRLAGCGIGEISGQEVFPETLETLDLSDNYITSLGVEILPERLTELDISRNKFRGLGEEFLLKVEHLKLLKLEGNPWACDLCHIVPLLERVNRSTTFRNLQCSQPYSSKGKKLGVLRMSELTWCAVPASEDGGDANFFLLGDDGQIGLIAASTSVALLFLAVVGALAALIYSRRHAARYYTHEDKLAMEGDSFDNHSPLFCEELSFKFPLDGEKKVAVATIDELKKELTNGS